MGGGAASESLSRTEQRKSQCTDCRRACPPPTSSRFKAPTGKNANTRVPGRLGERERQQLAPQCHLPRYLTMFLWLRLRNSSTSFTIPARLSAGMRSWGGGVQGQAPAVRRTAQEQPRTRPRLGGPWSATAVQGGPQPSQLGARRAPPSTVL